MRESCCTEEQHEHQRECADCGLESVFHLYTPSSLDNLIVLVLLRGGLNRSAFNPRESQLPACMKGKERTAPVSDGDFEKHRFMGCWRVKRSSHCGAHALGTKASQYYALGRLDSRSR